MRAQLLTDQELMLHHRFTTSSDVNYAGLQLLFVVHYAPPGHHHCGQDEEASLEHKMPSTVRGSWLQLDGLLKEKQWGTL